MRGCKSRGIIVRAMGSYDLPHCLRITIGTDEECTLVAETLAAFMRPMAEPLFQRLALIGIGLIGSSVARVASERGDLAGEVVANARTPEDARPRAGARHRRPGGAGSGARGGGADCVMLCTPVGAYAALAEAIAPHLAPGTILTDVGSTKQSVMRDVGPLVPDGVHFVPAHPIAGTEYSGPDAGFLTLFQGRWCLLTPAAGTDAAAVRESRGAVAPLRLNGRYAWSRRITTGCWRSSAICRICWPSRSAARPTIWRTRAARRCCNSPPPASAISPASRRPTR